MVALLAYRDGARHLIGRDGNVLEMEPREWMRGKDLTKALDAAIPPDLHLAMPDRTVTFQPMSLTDRSARAFARIANTRVGLTSLLAVVTLLALWGIVAGHLIPGVVLLILAAALGAQLWRTEMGDGRDRLDTAPVDHLATACPWRCCGTAAPSPGPRVATLAAGPCSSSTGAPTPGVPPGAGTTRRVGSAYA